MSFVGFLGFGFNFMRLVRMDMIAFGICACFMGACKPRQGFRASPGWVPHIPPKHTPQRYIDRYNLREEEEHEFELNEEYRQAFEEVYGMLFLDSTEVLDVSFFKDFLFSTFKKFGLFRELKNWTLASSSSQITPLLAKRSHEFIENCFRDPDLCKPVVAIHQREGDDFAKDGNQHYNVVNTIFPIFIAHDMIRIVMVDIANLGTSVHGWEPIMENSISTLFSEEPTTDVAWELDEKEEEIALSLKCPKFYGLEGHYSLNELCLIDFFRNAFDHSVGFRYADVLGIIEHNGALQPGRVRFVEGRTRLILPIPN